MIRQLIRLLIAVVLVGITHSLSAGERWETLQAIHLIENPTNSARPGAHGELGAYQFRRSTWQMHTSKPFRYALIRKHADEVAVEHYEWLCVQLRRKGIAPTPYNIAMAWNAGIGAVTSGRIPRVSRSYAKRVVAIVDQLQESQVAMSLPQRAPMLSPIIIVP